MGIDGKYGIITAEKKQFHPDEPVFVLRATDPLAPAAILEYARECEDAGCTKEHVEAALEHAYEFRRWQIANPGLVKHLPD